MTPAKAAPMREDELRAIAVRDEAVRALEIIRADTNKNVPNSARNDGSDSCMDGVHALASQALDFIGKLEDLAHTARPDAGDEDVERLRAELAIATAALRDIEEGPILIFEAGNIVFKDEKQSPIHVARAALAAMREGVDRGMVERAARIVEAGYRCRTCMAVFVENNDHINGGHPENGCEYPNWNKLEEAAQVEAIRALDTEQPR